MSKKETKSENKTVALNLAVNYGIEYGEDKPESIELAYAQLTKSYIEYAVTACHKDGLSSQFRRLYASIEKKIESAINTETFVATFTTSEFDFIVSAFNSDKAKFIAPLAKYVVKLEDAFLECK